MAVKKSEIYSSLWASCDALRGGMDASQYKDYILTLLFVKYVSDKFTGEDYADVEVPEGGSFDDMVKLIGKKNIGEGINKVIAKLAAANNLRGVIDKVSFNDPDKLGKGDEMVKKLSKLIEIFRRPELDFSKNRAEDDDLRVLRPGFFKRRFQHVRLEEVVRVEEGKISALRPVHAAVSGRARAGVFLRDHRNARILTGKALKDGL